jgi:hypothetical protein
MPIETVDAEVQLAVLEPLDVQQVRIVGDVLDLGRELVPVQTLGGFGPERLVVVDRFGVVASIGLRRVARFR